METPFGAALWTTSEGCAEFFATRRSVGWHVLKVRLTEPAGTSRRTIGGPDAPHLGHSRAATIACARVATCNLVKMAETLFRTVFSVDPNRPAISGFVS